MGLTLSTDNLPDYLRSRGLVREDERPIIVERLSGGVSGIVLKAVTPRRRLVAKQALPRLETADEWLCDPARILTEHLAIGTIRPFADTAVPTVFHADAENFVIVMDCAPEGSLNWRDELLAGRAEPWVAAAAGALLADIHLVGKRRPVVRSRFEDRKFFTALRVDPFHRKLMAAHPDLAGRLQAVIDRLDRHRTTLVHGDYSPKNVLVVPGEKRLILLDYEVAHWGDPAFDTSFCLGHLCLKAIRDSANRGRLLDCAAAFWRTYCDKTAGEPVAADEAGTVIQTLVLMLARVDGTSRAHYLTELQRDEVRRRMRSALAEPPATVDALLGQIHDDTARLG